MEVLGHPSFHDVLVFAVVDAQAVASPGVMLCPACRSMYATYVQVFTGYCVAEEDTTGATGLGL
jgi:hypothetical protein